MLSIGANRAAGIGGWKTTNGGKRKFVSPHYVPKHFISASHEEAMLG